MIILKKEWHAPTQEPDEQKLAPAKHQAGMKPRVGEMVILRDYPDAKDWYVAEVCQVLSDRFTVNGYIARGLPLAGYMRATKGAHLCAVLPGQYRSTAGSTAKKLILHSGCLSCFLYMTKIDLLTV